MAQDSRLVATDSRWQARLRLQQSLWRESQGLQSGPWPGRPGQVLASRLLSAG